MGVYAFALQIYGDFSGYSAIARGISKWLGFDLTVNFRLPYLAVSPSDFWRRWHVSLSSWLRDYLYIPLGGNRRGVPMLYRNLLLTMLLGGLWHGASWTFVAWGLFHGLWLCAFRLLRISDEVDASTLRGKARWALRVLLVFHLTCFGWLLFRADSFASVLAMVRALGHGWSITPFCVSALAFMAFHAGLFLWMEWKLEGEARLDRFLRLPWAAQLAAYAYFGAMMMYFSAGRTYEFIYFQF